MPRRVRFKKLNSLLEEQGWKRYLLLNALRKINSLAFVISFWPLILMIEWIDRRTLAHGLWTSALITLGLAVFGVIASIPLSYKQREARNARDLSRKAAADTADLSEIEDILYPDQRRGGDPKDKDAPGRHSARAMGEEDAFKAWRKARRSYWTQRILGTVGINVIRTIIMLVAAVTFGWLGYRIGMTAMLVYSLSAVIVTFYAFDNPNRSYSEIYKVSHFSVHIGMVVVFQLVRYFLGYPYQADFHLMILFFLTFVYFLTRNQSNIDSLMRQGSRSLKELPHGLRGFNARLTSLLTLAFPIIYLIRRPIAFILRLIWDSVVFVLAAIVNFISSLFPEQQDVVPEPVPTEGTDPPMEAGEGGGYWLRAVLTALVITLLIYLLRRYGRQIAAAIGEGLRKLKRFIISLFQGEEVEAEAVEEGRFYTDYHSDLDPAAEKKMSMKQRKKRWKQDYAAYRKQYAELVVPAKYTVSSDSFLRYREAYRLALRWLDLSEEEGLNPAETVREIARVQDVRLSEGAISDPQQFISVTGAYEDVRYSAEHDPDRQHSLDAIRDLEKQLEQMSKSI